MKINIITMFPEMFPAQLGYSLAGKALEKGIWEINIINMRDYAEDKHKTVDEKPFGGGAGMVIKPDVLGKAIEATGGKNIVYATPKGRIFNQSVAQEFAKKQEITFICGRFEGIDERVIDKYGIDEVSIGDFVLSGGEIAVLAMLDASIRLLPEVIGSERGVHEESFGSGEYKHLLEYPHYTRPAVWQDLEVPEVLLSGNHGEIENWRLEEAKRITEERRKDLWKKYKESEK